MSICNTYNLSYSLDSYLTALLRCGEQFLWVIEKQSFARSASQYNCALQRAGFDRCAVTGWHPILFVLFYIRAPCCRHMATSTLLYHHLIWRGWWAYIWGWQVQAYIPQPSSVGVWHCNMGTLGQTESMTFLSKMPTSYPSDIRTHNFSAF